MIRYVKQKNKYTCGPVAIINIMKWCGYNTSYKKDIKKIIKTTNTDVGGTYFYEIGLALENVRNIKTLIRHKINITEIKKQLKMNNVVLIDFDWNCNKINKKIDNSSLRHCSLVIGYNNETKKYKIVNHYKNETISDVDNEDFKKEIDTSCIKGIVVVKNIKFI